MSTARGRRTVRVLGTLVLGLCLAVLPGVAFAEVSPSYIPWDWGGPNTGTGGPHQDYRLTTEKCAVCHSVHAAAFATSMTPNPWSADPVTGPTEMLLRTSVANACNYCHIETNIGLTQVYGGVTSNYVNEDQFGHNGDPKARCADCHAVHGADTFQGALAQKILKANRRQVGNSAGRVQQELVAYYAGPPVNVANVFTEPANRNAQVSAFCTRCHKVFAISSDQPITASGSLRGSGTVWPETITYYNHPMKPFDAVWSKPPAEFVGQIAWADSTYCRSCHSAGLTEQAASSGGPGGVIVSSFPHYTPRRASFLVAGGGIGDAGATPVDQPVGDNDVLRAPMDGACLRCHRNGTNFGDSTEGVEINY